MDKIIFPDYLLNRMEARGITESQIADALRNISKQEERGERTRILSRIIDRYLMLLVKGGYHKTTVITALWRQ